VQIFPGAFASLFSSKKRDPQTIPFWVKASFVETSDGKQIELWRVDANDDVVDTGKVAILFHGNGDKVDNFVGLQVWFAQQGITSYSFDYRGYGKSTGWPSEKGLYLDSDAVWDAVISQIKAQPEDIMIVGYSIGTALATRLAAKHNIGTLVLLSAYSSIKELVGERALFKPLTPFLKYKLNTLEYISKLKETDLIAIHGKQDPIINFSHLKKVVSAYKGSGQSVAIEVEDAAHNDLFLKSKNKLGEKLRELGTI